MSGRPVIRHRHQNGLSPLSGNWLGWLGNLAATGTTDEISVLRSTRSVTIICP